MEFDFDAIEEEDSPFPEVRASVSNIDDPDMPALTIRMWFVGLLLCLVSSALNVFFNFRSPAPSVVPLALLLISYPFGKFLSFTLPITTYRLPLPRLPAFLVPKAPSPQVSISTFPPDSSFSQRLGHSIRSFPSSFRRSFAAFLKSLAEPRSVEFSLNPGPWNIKEHVLVFIMANVAVANPYAINAIVVSEIYYEKNWGYWFSLVFVLATQLTGFGLAGLCRRFLVWPASMVWPQNLVACTLLNTLHAEEEYDDPSAPASAAAYRGITRYRFFMWTTIGAFVFFFFPGFIFQALSIFSFICWAAPNNVPVNQLFGVYSGLGMSLITFDWTQISWIGSPLMVPWWAQVHVFLGFVLFYWILTPILYYTNSWQLAYFPISANEPYDRFGKVYDVSKVLRNDDTFDPEAYANYSPLYLPATYAVCYLIAFALSTCVITHTLLYHGRSLLNGIKKMKVETDDIHAKLMRNYPEVPDWWYLLSFCLFFGLAVVAVEVWHTEVPVWALVLAVLLPIIYILPSGFIYAMTGQGITLNILAQIIPGTLLPGNPLANMVFKSYSVQTLTEATSFVQDLKLGHYVKVPPRATFLVQLVSTVLAAFVQVGVKTWIFSNVADICQEDQRSQLTCPHNQVFFTASAVWGLIGPTRQFGTGSIYHPHLYAIIIGIFLPLPFWFWQRRHPNSWTKYVSTPVILNGVSAIPPATGINYSSWFAVGFVFQFLVRKRNFAWWAKFNYVASAAMDCGTVLSLIVIFFTLQFPRQGTIQLNWWGNEVWMQTADFRRSALKAIPDGGLPWPDRPAA
ncbi:OPT superfamily oligopeptide transporter [Dendrothele bispora CBS 962.96]|uniref:OPT superfamily oligopeptide transporter n=1 Tax=Dendrothele bispora (strain CBS 962.96) TaxID=1314807 RepID=A0A4S8MT43_DENBC|nr:OPT superfamily oligopeptide transporter [Dendrothele bispora CBS 962.96]